MLRAMSILKDLRTLVRALGVYFFVFFIHRLVFWFSFFPLESEGISYDDIIKSWWIGLRFDLRVCCFFLFFFLVLCFFVRWIFKYLPQIQHFLRPLQISLMTFGLVSFVFTLWFDFGNYAYLSERLSSKILHLAVNLMISLNMIMESYPIFWILLGFFLFVIAIFLMISRFVFPQNRDGLIFPHNRKYGWKDIGVGFIAFVFIIFCIHSRFSTYPLRWSEAYFSTYNFINQFGLNPLQNFVDTYKFVGNTYRQEDVVEDIELVKKDLGISDDKNFLLARPIKPNPLFKSPPNIVVIMMESLAAFRMSYFGFPLETTPHLDKLIGESLLFDNFHVPQHGTAVSVFCLFTGIPDLSEVKTATRNPLAVDQNVLVDNFKGHKKFFITGGSASWGNVRGVLQNNIQQLNFIEGQKKITQHTDVWGLSDINLFKKSHEIFKSLGENERFFAFVQTSGNHRPYTIPKKGTEGFKEIPLSEEDRKKYGFRSQNDFNSLRLLDHALGYFFDLAKKSHYYQNTLFVLYADHGVYRGKQPQLSSFYNQHHFPIYHAPLIFHSPLLPEKLKGSKNSILGYQPDILPTLQAITGLKGVNSAFGVDLLSEEANQRTGIFLVGQRDFPIKFFDGQRIIYTTDAQEDAKIQSYRTKDFLRQLYAILSQGQFLNQKEEINNEIMALARLARAYYRTMKFKLRNNQKNRVYLESN